MSRACAKWRGEIGAYIVGAIDTDLCSKVRAHLDNCEPCRAEYEDLAPLRDWLDLLVPLQSVSSDRQADRRALEPIRPVQIREGHRCRSAGRMPARQARPPIEGPHCVWCRQHIGCC